MPQLESDAVQTARMMMGSHGLRAGAVVQERVNEAQAASDTAALERWRAVQAAIEEMRTTAHKPAAPVPQRG